MGFELVSDFKPTGDQPQAIEKLAEGVNKGYKHQVLLGVTGSGKTFSIAHVIQNVQKPTLVISHNKILPIFQRRSGHHYSFHLYTLDIFT